VLLLAVALSLPRARAPGLPRAAATVSDRATAKIARRRPPAAVPSTAPASSGKPGRAADRKSKPTSVPAGAIREDASDE